MVTGEDILKRMSMMGSRWLKRNFKFGLKRGFKGILKVKAKRITVSHQLLVTL